MDRRNFLRLGALSGTSLLSAKWLFESPLAQARTQEVVSVNGMLNLNLVADERLIPYGNSKRWAMTYNGIFPGPILRAKAGDTLKINLTNKLSNPTNLHTHGLHASPSGNGDNPLLMINPGETFSYSIAINKNQKSGTFWYHPHHHELSASQVASGLAGAIIVEDSLDELPLLKGAKERIVVLADPRIGANASVANTSRMDSMRGRTGPHTLINGNLNPALVQLSQSYELWRVVNSCVSQYQHLQFPGAIMMQISVDSSRLPEPKPVTSIELTPGQRTEFLLIAPKSGKYILRNDYEALASITFANVSPHLINTTLLPFTKITSVTNRRTLNAVGRGMGMMGGGGAFTFDGKSFNPARIDQQVKFGSTEEWIINNQTNMHHPFHLHAWPFQVADDGFGNFLEGWHDTVNLPVGGTVRIRIPFHDIKGKTVYHCHILDHEDAGMMGIVQVS